MDYVVFIYGILGFLVFIFLCYAFSDYYSKHSNKEKALVEVKEEDNAQFCELCGSKIPEELLTCAYCKETIK